MKIGILQTGHAPDDLIDSSGDYDQMFCDLLAGHGFEFQTWAVVDGAFPDGPDAADGWIITGSKHGAYEDHDWIPPLEELIRKIDAAKRPMAGICFGHQIIAQALGGKVAKFDGGWAVGHVTYEQDGQPVTLNAWHQDQVVTRPKSARVLAGNDFCENGILAYGDHIWTVQPHPEFSNSFVQGLIEKRGRGVVPDPILERAAAGLSTPVDNLKIATFLAEFLKKERT
ncbi:MULTISPECIES: type 1 glutamine amidotransferase [Rhodobacterales]|jgi:GMP synthase (glutamine-hydrolysing)|uniref:Glutamine amidotransferase n=1 Tax=Phaeobacter gallaeciensis TaxID=60890 RepID=A0A1B0ZNA5_9RHOB|nr:MULTISPECIES: type 1 glutamine amidotransferase [Phaeobacter]MDF1771055.1 type 1 glutamine amidotransferase [Pseudophaeobacter sp. bin_em_oilr2.035]ANP35591.1 glutamine amidotransferase [Phaeobacter gallaeciensis]MDE4061298.1 type 1 glutamine amidotransferase [Phaeobacter gallaeciensis]MDE4098688.1 type 1 glutamine amidotransferase [Phaeobacter gallaeciensis]MDE4107555.1 type 1 glutamine amidotransferase [Phaeobacter gallaeciensis]